MKPEYFVALLCIVFCVLELRHHRKWRKEDPEDYGNTFYPELMDKKETKIRSDNSANAKGDE